MAQMKSKMEEKKKEIDQACGADIKKYCANVTPGQGREMACLKSYDDKISEGCKAVLPKRGMRKGMKHGGPMGDKHDSHDEGTDSPPEGK